MHWALKRRWTQAGELGWPMLDSPAAFETCSGQVSLAGATLTCGSGAGRLYANADAHCWVAGYHGPEAAPLKLTVPDGLVEVQVMGTGTLVWDHGVVTIDANDILGTPRVIGGRFNTGS